MSGLQAARRSHLVDEVIAALRAQIDSGAWPVGSRIPTEPELARQTGTGRNTVREAVQALVHAGLLQRKQGSGTFVLAGNELGAALGRHLEARPLDEVVESRQVLEAVTVRLAALRRTRADVRELLRLLAERQQAKAAMLTDDGQPSTADPAAMDAFVAADVDLHVAIARAGHNELLAGLYEQLRGAVRESVRATLGSRSPDDEVDHAELVAAIAAGDVDRAMAEAERYLRDIAAPVRPGRGPARPPR